MSHSYPNPDKPVVAKLKSRFIGELTIESSIENIQSFEDMENIPI